MWNMAKEGGWEAYEKITGQKAKTLKKIMDEKDTSIEEKMLKFERLHTKIKFRAFGKVQIKDKKRQTIVNHEEKKESAEEMLNKQKAEAEAEIEKLKTEHSSKAGRIWEMKKKIIAGKK